MRAKHDVAMHWCEFCRELFGDLCDEGENEDTGDYEYQCANGHNTTDEAMIFDVSHLWICGNCGAKYPTSDKAEECCL